VIGQEKNNQSNAQAEAKRKSRAKPRDLNQKRQIFASNAQVSRLGTGKMGKNS
jgi:hypothetical protein